MNYLYDCGCIDCTPKKELLQLSTKKPFKRLLKSVEKAFKKLHNNKGYKANDLLEVEEFKQVIYDTSEILGAPLTDSELPEEVITRFKEDVFVFSGLKTHAQLLEASKLLFEGKTFKSWSAFNQDIALLKKDYNENYLEAEYEYAVGTMQQVERWESFSDSDRYLLQYRTANDERVRDSHAALHNITLPKKSPFWDYYTPKNGWRCRCSTVEVLAEKNTISDKEKAMAKGEEATTQLGKDGSNKLEIFRYNPAKEKVIFPPKHPYQKVTGAKKLKKHLRDEF